VSTPGAALPEDVGRPKRSSVRRAIVGDAVRRDVSRHGEGALADFPPSASARSSRGRSPRPRLTLVQTRCAAIRAAHQ
jgi:hypothetical protein